MSAGLLSLLALSAHLLVVGLAIVLIPTDRKPSSATAWLLLITVAPFVGVVLFLLIGSPRLPRRRRKIQRGIASLCDDAALPAPLDDRRSRIAELARGVSGLVATGGNRIDVMAGYDEIIAAMTDAVGGARTTVHCGFYILAMDRATEALLQALEAAAGRGVAVKVLFDHLGSRKFPGFQDLQGRLSRAGIEWHLSLPLFDRKGWLQGEWLRPDLRNHRKILVVDGAVGFTGSLNLIDRHYHRSDAIRYEELCVRVEGPAAAQLDAVFRADWMSETGQDLRPVPVACRPAEASAAAQVLPSGSGLDAESNLRVFTALIYAARRRLVLVTPYFVPDEALMLALTSAVARGVKVTVVNSEAVDQALVVSAQHSFYAQLLRAGIELRLYRAPTLLHAKTLLVDDDVCTIGSSNLDIRSFTLNLEVTLVVYDTATAAALSRTIDGFLAETRIVDAHEWEARPLRRRIAENLARLTAALQ
ncbi:phospholipase D-like domain-containing protein [Alsobacter sp. R-9]